MVCVQFSVFISPIFFTDLKSPPRATVAFVAWCGRVSVTSCAFVIVLVWVFIWGYWGIFQCIHN